MNRTKRFLLTGTILASITGLYTPNIFAADVSLPISATLNSSIDQTPTQNLNFGTIDLAPTVTTVTINASSASATPTATGATIVTGGNNGVITVQGAMNLTITVAYPNDSTVQITNNTDTVYVNNIANNSQGGSGTISHTGGSNTSIRVGGAVTFTGSETNGTYNGTMPVVLTYN